jgi:hypothetical protein
VSLIDKGLIMGGVTVFALLLDELLSLIGSILIMDAGGGGGGGGGGCEVVVVVVVVVGGA